MKVIIAEKPSVAREIAPCRSGYQQEEWLFRRRRLCRHVGIGTPDNGSHARTYGIKGFRKENLPILPPIFTLIPRQIKEGKGYKADAAAVAQLKIIEKLFRACEAIIVATDAGREGRVDLQVHLRVSRHRQTLRPAYGSVP